MLQLSPGDRLHTRDGRRIGNATVIMTYTDEDNELRIKIHVDGRTAPETYAHTIQSLGRLYYTEDYEI